MEQPDDLSGREMPSRDVRTFMPIAMETCEREVVCVGCAAVLAGDDVVDVERQRVSEGRQSAVFATARGPLPHVPHEIGIHNLPAAEGKPGFGLDHGKQVTDVKVAVEFGALLIGQFAGLRPFGQLTHAVDVAIRESDREQILRRLRQQLTSRVLHEPRPDPRLPVRTENLSVHLRHFQFTANGRRAGRPRQSGADPAQAA